MKSETIFDEHVDAGEKIHSITILGRRWFNRGPGNTYFSAVGMINGEVKVKINFAYGYGDHYVDMITQQLEKDGFIPDLLHHNNGSTEGMWQYCQRKGIKYMASATDVQRKKDL